MLGDVAESRVHTKRYMHLVRVDHCSFFINRKNTFLQIKIRAREANIKEKSWFNYSEIYPSFYEDCLFMGVN